MPNVKRREKPEDEPRKTKPEDLKKVGVGESGLAMGAAKVIEQRRKQMEKALKEIE